jgi:hypothetical protein
MLFPKTKQTISINWQEQNLSGEIGFSKALPEKTSEVSR